MALPSSGLHTNGYSLARKLVFGVAKLKPNTYVAEIRNKIGAELLKPHRCYWPLLKNIVARGWVTSMAHITGGGITGNLPRVLSRNVQAVVELGSWPVLPIFRYLAGLGKMEPERAAEDIQPRRGHDPDCPFQESAQGGSRVGAPPREVLRDRPHRAGRPRKASNCLHRQTTHLSRCGAASCLPAGSGR